MRNVSCLQVKPMYSSQKVVTGASHSHSASSVTSIECHTTSVHLGIIFLINRPTFHPYIFIHHWIHIQSFIHKLYFYFNSIACFNFILFTQIITIVFSCFLLKINTTDWFHTIKFEDWWENMTKLTNAANKQFGQCSRDARQHRSSTWAISVVHNAHYNNNAFWKSTQIWGLCRDDSSNTESRN